MNYSQPIRPGIVVSEDLWKRSITWATKMQSGKVRVIIIIQSSSSSYDKVVGKGGKTVGLSMFAGYSHNERWCGRRRRRNEEADGGAPQTDGSSRRCQSSALFEGRARVLRGRLADASDVSEVNQSKREGRMLEHSPFLFDFVKLFRRLEPE